MIYSQEFTMKEVLLNIESRETRLALLKFGKLYDLIIERKSNLPLVGNVYRGKVTNILHNIQSAFININEGDNGFIHISDIIENTQKFQEMFEMDFDWDWDVQSLKSTNTQEKDISKLMKTNDSVLVQVVKEPIGSKGARLTSNISIPGRYLVLLPNTPHRGVSHKIQDCGVRDRLKKTIRSFEMPKNMGLICRTASINASTECLIEEAHELLKTWESIMDNFKASSKPVCLYRESNLLKRAILIAMDKKFDRLLIDDYKTYQTCKNLYQKLKTEHPLKIELYSDKVAMFERFSVENDIEKALKRKVWLPSGGHLFFDKTEAMYTIDINSGRSTHPKTTKDVEEALVHINMEAANEIARQLRLRNVGGLIICDFIDMRSRKNQRRVLDCLKEAMNDDHAKCTIIEMSEFGLLEMTRQRSRESLFQTLFTECPYCNGQGLIKNNESIIIDIQRALKKLVTLKKQDGLKLVYHPQLDKSLTKRDKTNYLQLAKQWETKLEFAIDDNLHVNDFEFYSISTGNKIEL